MKNTFFAILLILALGLGLGIGVSMDRNSAAPCSAKPGDDVPAVEGQLSSSNWDVAQHLKHDNGMTRRIVYRDSDTGFEYDLHYYDTGRLRSLTTRRNGEETGPFFEIDATGRALAAGIEVMNEALAGSWWRYFDHNAADSTKTGFSSPDSTNPLAVAPLPALERESWTIREGAGNRGARRGYTPEGRLRGTVPTLNGKLHGPSFDYRGDGSVEFERIFVEGNETRRKAYRPDGSIRHLKILQRAEGKSVFESYDPGGNLTFRRTISGGQGSERFFYPDGTVEEETLRKNGFPSERREYSESGALISILDYIKGEKRVFDDEGGLKLVEELRFNALISRSRYGSNGKLLESEEFDDPKAMLPKEGEAIEFQSLPGVGAKLPQAYHAYFQVPKLINQLERKRAWPQTMNDWFQQTDFTGGTYNGWRPFSTAGARGSKLTARFIAPLQLSAIGLAAHVARGPLWLSLTLYGETSGRRSEHSIARSWIWLPEKPAFPSGGLIVFPLPEVEFKPNEPYWFVCEVDRASSAENAYWNYPFLESEPVAYRLIGDFDSVPMQRPAKLDESKSGAARQH